MSMKKQKHETINRWVWTWFLATTLIILPVGAQAERPESDIVTRVDTLLQQRHWSQASSLMEAHLVKSPSDLEIRRRLIHLYMLQHRHAEARKLAESAYTLFPDSIAPIDLESDVLLGPLVTRTPEKKESTLAQLNRLALQAAAINELDPTTLYIKGVIASLNSLPPEAETYFLRALNQDPNYIKAQHALVEMYSEQEQPRLAIPILLQAIEQDPHNVDTLYLLGKVFVQKGDPEKGLIYLKESRTQDLRERPKRQLVLADAQRQLGQLEDASESYRTVLEVMPNRSDLWVKYAQLSDTLNQEDKAINAYRKAYALDPGILTKLVDQATEAFWTKGLAETLPDYQRLYRITPENPQLLTLMAAMAFRLWQENKPPSPILLDKLASDIRSRDSFSPALQLADLKIQVIRNNGFHPGLEQVLESIAQDNSDPLTQAYARIIQHRPVEALRLQNAVLNQTVEGYDTQMLVLHGAWPWAQQSVDATTPLASWVGNWSRGQKQQADESLLQARQNLDAQRYGEAEKSLKQARFYFPFSARIYLRLVQAYLGQDKIQAARQALRTAKALDLPESDAETVASLQKQLDASLRP